jgi:hypothetical protein
MAPEGAQCAPGDDLIYQGQIALETTPLRVGSGIKGVDRDRREERIAQPRTTRRAVSQVSERAQCCDRAGRLCLSKLSWALVVGHR